MAGHWPWRWLGGSTGGQSEQGRKGDASRSGLGSSGKELPSACLGPVSGCSTQPCAHGCAQPLPWHCRFLQFVYLLHITLSDGSASSQNLSHLGHDGVVVHAGHSHHLVAPRAGRAEWLGQPRELWLHHPRNNVLEKSRKQRETPAPGSGPVPNCEHHGDCVSSMGQGTGGGSELRPRLTCSCAGMVSITRVPRGQRPLRAPKHLWRNTSKGGSDGG